MAVFLTRKSFIGSQMTWPSQFVNREKKSIEEIAAVRWGSLDNFKKLLAKAEGGSGSDRSTNQDRRHGSSRRARSRSPDRRQKSPERSRDRKNKSRSRSRDSRSRSRERRRRSRSRSKDRRRDSPQRKSSKFSRPDLDENRFEVGYSDRRGDTKGVGRWKTDDRRKTERETESRSRKKSETESSSSSSEDEAPVEKKSAGHHHQQVQNFFM
jgi:hypothetical protein